MPGHLYGAVQNTRPLWHSLLAIKEASVTRNISLPASQAWQIVRDFAAPWHPAINAMSVEYDRAGHLTRVFTVHGEPTCYRERLTWFSDTNRELRYEHLEGIAGADKYQVQLTVAPAGAMTCAVTMSAVIEAAEPRASEIATGTQAIFEVGLEALAEHRISTASKTHLAALQPEDIADLTTDKSPRLAFSVCENTTACQDTIVLFLHGIGGNRSNWKQQLAAVAPYCTAVALDLRGYGGSSLGPDQSTVEDYCADILCVMAQLNAKKVILCGLSYGAWIATSFAMRHNDLLAGLILAGGCTGMSEASRTERLTFLSGRETPLRQGQTPADFAPNVVSVIAEPDCGERVRAELLSSMQSISSATYADALRCFTHPSEIFDFTKIDMPVLLMTGEHDKLAPPAEIQAVAERIHAETMIPDVRFEVLENAGHVCNLEAAEAFNRPLVDLVRRILS